MKYIVFGIAVIVVIALGIPVVISFTSSFLPVACGNVSTDTMISEMGSPYMVLGSLVAVTIIAICICGFVVVSNSGSLGDIVEDDIEDDEPEPIQVKRKDAQRILMERFARGEITNEQYTEQMSRL